LEAGMMRGKTAIGRTMRRGRRAWAVACALSCALTLAAGGGPVITMTRIDDPAAPPPVPDSTEFAALLRETVERAAEDEAVKSVSAPDRFEVVSVRFGGADPLPAGTVELRLVEADGPGTSGTVRVRFAVLVDGHPFGQAWATVRGSVLGPALVSTTTLRHGEPIPADAVKRTEVDLTRLSSEPLRDIDEIESRVAASSIGPGRTLTESLVRAEPVVRRGETVELSVRRGNLVVTVPGRVKRDGAPGQIVPAENLRSGIELMARVESDGSLVVVRAGERNR
jgi:flagella basal body P-ring formation protein FlgA